MSWRAILSPVFVAGCAANDVSDLSADDDQDAQVASAPEAAGTFPQAPDADPAPDLDPLPDSEPEIVPVDPADEAAEIAQQHAAIASPFDEAPHYTSFLSNIISQSGAVIVVQGGPVQWAGLESNEEPWAVATVLVQNGCPGVGTEIEVRVRMHSELPDLQPSDEKSILVVGNLFDGVLLAELALPWTGAFVEFQYPRRDVAFTQADLDSACEEKGR